MNANVWVLGLHVNHMTAILHNCLVGGRDLKITLSTTLPQCCITHDRAVQVTAAALVIIIIIIRIIASQV